MAEGAPANPVPDARTRADQSRAADPVQSAWVSANAGAGKTWVLATRVIRILLGGTDPSKILCLTYTRAAAAEMKSRVFGRLGQWVTMADDALRAEIDAIEGRPPAAERMAFARTLFARALETPGGLKIQTIHAFCEALLHRFPLEANIAGHFELVDPEAQALLVAQARRGLLGDADARLTVGTGDAVMRILAITGENGLENLLDEIVARRIAITDLIRQLGTGDDRRDAYHAALDLDASDTSDSLVESAWPLPGLDPGTLQALADSLPDKGANDARKLTTNALAAGRTTDPAERFAMLEACFFTERGVARGTGRLFSAGAVKTLPDFAERYDAARTHVARLRDRLHLMAEVDNTLDVLSIADGLIARYERLKRARGLLDFEDLIARTANMLLRDDAALWVRYKLDQGIDHILIDEAQDTAPAQWDVIRTLAGEFFAGAGASETGRTVFAVGDEKQSIYSFQGADPDQFAESRDLFAGAADAARRPFETVRLQASFRSTQAVLDAVDCVFADETARAGLTRDDAPVRHRSLRKDASGNDVLGQVDIWETVAKSRTDPPEDWTAPVDATAEPAIIVADRIADTIARWVGNGTVNTATGKPITAGDILVLVRSRDGFVNALSRALKDRAIAVAGADRLTLTDHIAVLDLIALGRVMLNPADDLSLAALLKSPLFGLDDDALFDLAHDRGADTLWTRLATHGGKTAQTAHRQLDEWRQLAASLPVHDFYAQVLAAGDARAGLTGRLGPETGDVIDEFLALALATERTGPPALETFVSALETHAPQIKREMDPDRGEVRIMTVHGAKGLEAPIVFLVDRGGAPFHASQAPGLLRIGLGGPGEPALEGFLWRGTPGVRSQVHADAMTRLEQAAREEYRRLLYVGMTRAADRLIVAGYRGSRPSSEPTWHDMVASALAEKGETVETDHGAVVRFPAGLGADSGSAPAAPDAETAAPTMPAGFSAKAPPEPPPARPLIPSGAAGLAIADGAPETQAGSPSLLARSSQPATPIGPALRGTIVHTLLQMLPDIEPSERTEKARRYCAAVAPALDRAQVDDILAQVFAIIDNARFAPLFGSRSIAEVPVMGTIEIGGQDRAVSGVIDRLAVVDETVWIVDYKTGRFAPRTEDEVPVSHVRQMALYRALIAPLYPHKTVLAALLYTAGPTTIELSPPRLDAVRADLAQA